MLIKSVTLQVPLLQRSFQLWRELDIRFFFKKKFFFIFFYLLRFFGFVIVLSTHFNSI